MRVLSHGLVAAAAFSVCMAMADTTPGGAALDFVSENDAYGHHGDRYYTGGLRLAYVSAASVNTGADDATWRWFAGAAQELYTAADRYAANPPAGDHPYSAWLYATAGVALVGGDTLDLLTLNAGVVGPSALGEQAQSNWHRAIGVKTLHGWDTQLSDEPGVDVAAVRVWRVCVAGGERGWGVQVLPRVGAEVGTVRDVAKLAVQWRFGQNLPADFGSLALRDGISGACPVRGNRARPARWAPDVWYAYADLQGEAWARNMALDGNLWRDSRAVDSKPFVGQASCGLVGHWGAARVAVSQTLRTREFSTQPGVFLFGAISVTVLR